MTQNLCVFLTFICCSLTVSCHDGALSNTAQDSEKEGAAQLVKPQYLVFGHTNGFCLNCDVLYKIENDSIYATRFSTNLNPDSAVFSFLKKTDDNSLIGRLPYTIPLKLLNEQNVFIGTTRPDVGHYYFEIKTGEKVKHWYVEAANVPSYLTSYLADVQVVMSNLR